MCVELRMLLQMRAVQSQCISYQALANVLGVTEAPIIATVTGLLETLIDEDVDAGRPVLAALAVQKGQKQLPRLGFFEKLDLRGVIQLNQGFDERKWHTNELVKLQSFYKKNICSS